MFLEILKWTLIVISIIVSVVGLTKVVINTKDSLKDIFNSDE